MGQQERFDITVSGEDVSEVLKAIMKRFKEGRDEPVKTVCLALSVAEIEVLFYKDLIREYCTNVDEVIKGLRLQASEKASYMYDNFSKGH